MRQWKFKKELNYGCMRRLEHKGEIGHKRGQNIVVHVVSMLDDNAKYRVGKDGKWYVKDIYEHKNGKYRSRKRFVRLEDHNKAHFPKISNPSVVKGNNLNEAINE